MRTTLTLDHDVAARIEQERGRTGKRLKAVVNEALRLGLGIVAKPKERPSRFRVRPHAFGVKPGFDLDRMNQLVDELDAAEVACKLQS